MINDKIKLEMIKKLIDAQYLLASVYDYACENGIEMVESSMSCADSCVIESIDYLNRE